MSLYGESEPFQVMAQEQGSSSRSLGKCGEFAVGLAAGAAVGAVAGACLLSTRDGGGPMTRRRTIEAGIDPLADIQGHTRLSPAWGRVLLEARWDFSPYGNRIARGSEAAPPPFPMLPA